VLTPEKALPYQQGLPQYEANIYCFKLGMKPLLNVSVSLIAAFYLSTTPFAYDPELHTCSLKIIINNLVVLTD